MKTTKKGDIGVAKAIANITEQDLNVLFPMSEDLPFDLVVYDGCNFYKVQVKYRSIDKNGILRAGLRRATINRNTIEYRNYDKKEVDIICIFCPDTDKCYYIDYKSWERSSFHLRVLPPKNDCGTSYYAKDFESIRKILYSGR